MPRRNAPSVQRAVDTAMRVGNWAQLARASRVRRAARFASARRSRNIVGVPRRIGYGDSYPYKRWGILDTYSSSTGQGGINFASADWTYSAGLLTTNVTSSGVTELPFSMQFAFNQIAGNGDFANLYDFYRIKGVEVRIKMLNVPDADTVPGSSTTNQFANYYPTLWYTPDYDDVSLQNLATIREYKNARHVVMQPNKEISMFVRPQVLAQIYNSNTSAGYQAVSPGYIDLVNGALPHYGLKCVMDFEGLSVALGSANNPFRFRLNVRYYFDCKDVR